MIIINRNLKRIHGGGDSEIFLFKYYNKNCILKIYQFFSPAEVKMEIIVMNHLAKHNFPTPRPIKFENNDQFLFCKNQPAIIYPYIDGQMTKEGKITSKICEETGILMAKIDKKLKKLHIPNLKGKKTIWDLMQFENVEKLIQFVPTHYQYLIPKIKEVFNGYKKIKPILNKLPKKLILNDISETNLLTKKGRVSGLVDFSDIVYAPYICNLAIAAAHLCFDDKNWQNKLKKLMFGYRKYNKLSQRELTLLPNLVRSRVVTLIIGNLYQQKIRGKKYDEVIRKNVKKLNFLNKISDKEIINIT